MAKGPDSPAVHISWRAAHGRHNTKGLPGDLMLAVLAAGLIALGSRRRTDAKSMKV